MSELSKLEKRIADVRAEQVRHERLSEVHDSKFHQAAVENVQEDMTHFQTKKRETVEYLEMLTGQLTALESMRSAARLADTLPIIDRKSVV